MRHSHRSALLQHGGARKRQWLLLVCALLLAPLQLPAQDNPLPIVPEGTITNRLPTCWGWYCGSVMVAMHGSAAVYDGGMGILELFTRVAPDTWSATKALVNPDYPAPPELRLGAPVQDFGAPVALDQRVMLISGGSPSHPNALYVFTRPGRTWTHAQTIDLPKPDGYYRVTVVDIALHENTAIVLVRYHNSVRAFKEVHWYTRTTGQPFVYQGMITPALGNQLALQKSTALMIDPRADGDRGAAYVFQRTGSQWTQTQKLTGSGTAPFDGFGLSAAFDQNTIVISAPDQPNASDERLPGAVYTFVRNSGVWVEDSVLRHEPVSDPEFWKIVRFGQDVALSGDRLLVDTGRSAGSPSDMQAVVLYERSNLQWQARAELGCQNIIDVMIAGDAAFITHYDPIRPTPNVTAYLLPPLGTAPPPATSTCQSIAGFAPP
jgi:hypothetical protein